MKIEAADMATAWSYPALKGEVVQERHARFCAKYGHATHHVGEALQERCPRCGDLRMANMGPAVQPVEAVEAVEPAKAYKVYGQNIHTLTPAFEVETFTDKAEADSYARNMKRLDHSKFDYWVQ